MKILLVTHGFPPHQTAGTESYAADLGAALASGGHAVHVFSARKDIARRDYGVERRVWRGLSVSEVTNNLFHRAFEETWDNPAIERAFQALLAELRPDVVHVQHLMYLSAGCVRLAREAGARVVYTLHDFWLQCPRLGQRVHADGSLCDTIDFARCGTCLARFKYRNSALERRVGGLIAGISRGTGLDLAPLARGTARRLFPRRGEAPHAPSDAHARLHAAAARQRTERLRTDLVPRVDLFLSPSRFLRERFLAEWGLAPERIEHLPFGVDARAVRRPRAANEPVRVAFVGSLVPLKGAHLLIEAWSRLDPALRARGRLALYGPARHHPAYQQELARAAERSGATLGGLLARDRVAEVLAATDLLVVPSTWFENAPLVILEARAAHTPLLVSDIGGMAELVEQGVHGWHFRAGDAAGLARGLAEVLEGRLDVEALYRGAAPLPTFAEHVARVETRYREVASRGGVTP